MTDRLLMAISGIHQTTAFKARKRPEDEDGNNERKDEVANKKSKQRR